MKSFNISLQIKQEPGVYFVIGVKGDSSSCLDAIKYSNPTAIIKPFKEVVNGKYIEYIDRDRHILQPAIITIV